jgi:NhaP-type Na+/H+ and K+/H+ antiporter
VGKTMIALHFPLGVLATRIERNGVHIFPSGTTRIEPEDRITVITSKPRELDKLAKRWGLTYLAPEVGIARGNGDGQVAAGVVR